MGSSTIIFYLFTSKIKYKILRNMLKALCLIFSIYPTFGKNNTDINQNLLCSSEKMVSKCIYEMEIYGCMDTCKSRLAQLALGNTGVRNIQLMPVPINCNVMCNFVGDLRAKIEERAGLGALDMGLPDNGGLMDDGGLLDDEQHAGTFSMAATMNQKTNLDEYEGGLADLNGAMQSRVCESLVEITRGCGRWPSGDYNKALKAKVLMDNILLDSIL